MFKQLVLFVAIFSTPLITSRADYQDQSKSIGSPVSSASKSLPAAQLAQDLLADIGAWLASNCELPAVPERPIIEFVSDTRIAAMRLQGLSRLRGAIDHRYTEPAQRRPVALYDDSSRTIFLPDDWVGQSAADKSILVHEMVHHIQSIARIKYECPMAREKPAYLAQDKWLAQFGLSLEREFEVDMFTVVVLSACIY
jgi:hypothetical protein